MAGRIVELEKGASCAPIDGRRERIDDIGTPMGRVLTTIMARGLDEDAIMCCGVAGALCQWQIGLTVEVIRSRTCCADKMALLIGSIYSESVMLRTTTVRI